VVVYTWNFHPELVDSALRQGAHGYLSKTLTARELVLALEAVHTGEVVVSDPPPRARSALGLEWPGREEGLTDREAEVLALITQGKSNAEVAALTCLSPNTVKSYIRNTYRKIDVASRTQAVLWGVAHGFTPDPRPHRLMAHRGVIQPPSRSPPHSGPPEGLRNSLADTAAGHLLELIAISLLQVAIDASMIESSPACPKRNVCAPPRCLPASCRTKVCEHIRRGPPRRGGARG
jgi:DNA-binding CsgD family transcriptional regulator